VNWEVLGKPVMCLRLACVLGKILNKCLPNYKYRVIKGLCAQKHAKVF
jgi:hypothetical protein